MDTAPKASGCFLGGTLEIFGAVSEDLLGGTGKAEDAKLPGAGIIIPRLAQWKGRDGINAPKQTESVRRGLELQRRGEQIKWLMFFFVG